MDPAIAGTLIGGGFALVGVAASIWATSRTLKANRELAREERLWEKRAALYEQLFEKTESFRQGDLRPIFDGLLTLNSSVHAYASDAVLSQYRVTLYTLASFDEPIKFPVSDTHPLQLARETIAELSNLVRADLQATPRPVRRRLRRLLNRRAPG